MNTFAVVGAGVIGAGWAARALAHGLDVIAWDVAPGWEARLRASVSNAWPALERLGLRAGADIDRLRTADSQEALCAEADFIQEAVPERLALKTSAALRT